MPTYLKIIICLIVATAAALTYYVGINAKEVVLGVAALMIIAIWLFPEASGGKGIDQLARQKIP
ncbi:MAG: hypothetical protein GKS00_13310 [Alphaproteobacteria bacterium]|nr:hypothetical protein [Alphaproteobacteria bacterium]